MGEHISSIEDVSSNELLRDHVWVLGELRRYNFSTRGHPPELHCAFQSYELHINKTFIERNMPSDQWAQRSLCECSVGTAVVAR